jgi:hypothetical protein
MWFFGLPVLAWVFWIHPSPLLILIGILAVPQLIAAWQGSGDAVYYAASLENRIIYGLFYIGLVVFLALMCFELHNVLGPAMAWGR